MYANLIELNFESILGAEYETSVSVDSSVTVWSLPTTGKSVRDISRGRQYLLV